jgi:hypothetical protein
MRYRAPLRSDGNVRGPLASDEPPRFLQVFLTHLSYDLNQQWSVCCICATWLATLNDPTHASSSYNIFIHVYQSECGRTAGVGRFAETVRGAGSRIGAAPADDIPEQRKRHRAANPPGQCRTNPLFGFWYFILV